MFVLEGEIHSWHIPGTPHTRRWATLAMTFEEIRNYTKIDYWDSLKQSGNQRPLVKPHVKKLKTAYREGKMVPASISLSLTPEQRDRLRVSGNRFSLELSEEDRVPLTDGQHRTHALNELMAELLAGRDRLPEVDQENLQTSIEQILSMAFPVTLHIDGDTVTDFLALQEGRAVDKAQMTSMKASRLEPGSKGYIAMQIATLLDNAKEGPFTGTIRFGGQENAILPVSTLCAASSSDLATSLIGTAAIMQKYPKVQPKHINEIASWIYRSIQVGKPEIINSGKILTPPVAKGTKGAATMFVGVLNCVLFRFCVQGHFGRKFGPEEETHLLASLKSLDANVDGSFSSALKREYLALFAGEYFKPMEESHNLQMHEGIPLTLLEILPPSTFGISPIPGQTRGRGRPRKIVHTLEHSTQTQLPLEPEPKSEPEPIVKPAKSAARPKESVSSLEEEKPKKTPAKKKK